MIKIILMSRYYVLLDFKYLEFFHHYAVQSVLDFLHAPNDKGSPFCLPQDIGPSSRSLGAVSPVLPSPSHASPLLGERWLFSIALAGCPLIPATSKRTPGRAARDEPGPRSRWAAGASPDPPHTHGARAARGRWHGAGGRGGRQATEAQQRV